MMKPTCISDIMPKWVEGLSFFLMHAQGDTYDFAQNSFVS